MTSDDDIRKTEEQRKFDEMRTMIVDSFPKLWRGLYEGCISEGFDTYQSLELVKTFILKPSQG